MGGGTEQNGHGCSCHFMGFEILQNVTFWIASNSGYICEVEKNTVMFFGRGPGVEWELICIISGRLGK